MAKAYSSVKATLTYFDYFHFPLTADEIYRYYPTKIGKKELLRLLDEGVAKNELEYDDVADQYALRGHSIFFKKRLLRQGFTATKLKRVDSYLKVLYALPYIELIGLSGSCAMGNAQEKDDVDIFIISAPGRMWLSRISAILLAKVCGIHRSKRARITQNKVCLNLFFDRGFLEVPESKKNIYVAHEVAQMRPLYIRGGAYEQFLVCNSWISSYFPHVKIPKRVVSIEYRGNLLGNMFEKLARHFQLALMSPRTKEIITEGQLWFFPQDFEAKLRKKEVI